MSIELIEDESPSAEYILVSDQDSQVVFASDWQTTPPKNPLAETIKLANLIRKAGGSVTVFKATKY